MNQKISIYFFAFLILLGTIIPASAQNTETQNALLWKVSGNGLKQDSYLFGTIHIIPKADYIFTSYMKSAFNSCSKLALEVDMDMTLSEKISLAQRAMFPGGKTLESYLSPEEFEQFHTYMLDSLKLKKKKYKAMLKMQPFFASGIMIQDQIKKPKMYENEFMKMAKKRDIPLVGLETIEYQMSVIESISPEKQVEMTYKGNLSGNPMDEYQLMVDAYKAQNINLLHDYTSEAELGKETQYALLTQRNLNWIPVISKLIEKEACFIAVGAGHLPGESGVINLLRKEGYHVEAVF